MRRRAVLLQWLVGAAVMSVTAAPALGYHTKSEQVTDDSPAVLRERELRLGLWKIEYGLPHGAQLGTYSWPWAAWALGVRLANVHAKLQIFRREAWTASVGAGLIYLDLANRDVPATFTVVPVEAHVAYRLGPRLTLGAGARYTRVGVSGDYEPDEDDLLRGAVAVSNLQPVVRAEWRLSRVTALIGEARVVAFQEAAGSTFVETELDPYTTIQVRAEGTSNAADVSDGYSVTSAAVFSWSTFNLRVGVTYGNYTLPMVYLVADERGLMPELDAFWRF